MTEHRAEERPGPRAHRSQPEPAAARRDGPSRWSGGRLSPSTTPVLLVFAVVAATVVVGAAAVYHRTLQGLRREKLVELLEVADLKAAQIGRWRQERLAEGLAIGNASYFGRAFVDWAARGAPDDAERARLLARIGAIRDGYGYRKVWLTDVSGIVRLIAGEEEGLSREAQAAIEEGRRDLEPRLTDLHRDDGESEIAMDLAVPLVDLKDGQTALGFYVCEWDPGTYLFPLVQRWPGPSRTAETLLVRQADGDVLFLNELRHKKGTALVLKVPARANLPAAQALLGRGAGEGIDYRGVPVLGAWRPVPGTGWGIVAKVDVAEVFAPVRLWGGLMAGILALLVAVSSVAVSLRVRQERLWLQLREKTAELERAAHERALRVSEEGLRATFELAAVGIAHVGVDGRFLRVNPKLCRILGRSEEELLQMTFGDVTHLDDVGANMEGYRTLLTGAAAFYGAEKRYLRPDGSVVWANLEVAPVRGEDGATQWFISVVEDLSEVRRSRAAAREAQEYAQGLVANANVMIVGLDAGGRVTLMNEAAERVTGYSSAEMNGRDWFSTLVPRHRYPEVWAEYERMTRTGGVPRDLENPIVTKSGRERFISWRNAVVRSGDLVTGTISFGLDMTVQKAGEERLRAMLELAQKDAAVPEAEVVREGIELAERLTSSALGYCHVVGDDQQTIELMGWSRGAAQGREPLRETRYAIDAAGIWADCTRTRRPVIHNDTHDLPDRGGDPEIHSRVDRHLSVPVLEGDRVRMILEVGNKPEDYDEEDVRQVQLVAANLWQLVRTRRAEALARQTGVRFRQLVQGVSAIVWEARLDPLSFTFVSDEAERLLGYPKEKWLDSASFWSDRVHAEDRAATEEALASILATGEGREFDNRVIAAGGRTLWLREIVRVEKDESGRPLKLLGLSIDVTQEKEAARRIERLNALLGALSETSKAIGRCTDRQELFSEICRITVASGDFRVAWVAWADHEAKTAVLVASAGSGAGVASELSFSLDPDKAEARGPTPTAIREGRLVVVDDFLGFLDALGSERPSSWQGLARRMQLGAAAAVPLRQGGVVVGALALAAAEKGYFDPEMVGLLEGMGSDISRALDAFDERERRHVAEEAARESEARLRQFAEYTDDVVWINGVTPERKVYLSPSVERVWGVPANRFLAEPRGWMESVAPEHRQKVREAYDAVVEGRAARYESEYRISRPGGDTRWILDSGKPVRDATGRLLSVVGIAKDITTRKLAEEKAARTSRLYEALSATNKAVVHSATPEELYRRVCDAAVLGGDFPIAWIVEVEQPGTRIRYAAVAGRSREMAGEVPLSLDPADLHSRGPTMEALLAGTTVIENDLVGRFDSNPGVSPLSGIPKRFGVASVAAVPLRRNGSVVGCLTVFSAEKGTFDAQFVALLEEMGRDVSFALDTFDREDGRRKAEAALRESEERWRTIVQNEPECVKVLDREGRLLEMNPAGLSMIQATLDQVVGKRAAGLVAEEDRPAFDEMVGAAFRGETRHLVFDMIGLEGRRLTLETTSGPLWDTTEDPPVVSAVLGVTRDVSERKRAEEALRESERALREAQALGRMGSYVFDFPTDAWSSSEVLDGIFGIDATYVRNVDGWLALVAPTQREEMGNYLKRLAAEHRRFDRDYRIVRRSDGEERWVHGMGVVEYADDGTPRRLRGTIQDITERKRDEERLRRAAAVFSSSREGFVVTNGEGDIEEINEAFTAITGYARAEVVGRNMRILHSGRQGPAFYQAMWTEILRSGQWQGEIWNRRKDDTVFPAWVSISVVRGESSRVAGYVGVFSDISTLTTTRERLDHLARYDPLTDLPNRLLLESYLGLAVSRSLRSGRAGAVLFLDLDRFKNVNDSLGHSAGDEVLRATARRLRERLREGDLIARLGGDEFVVLLESVDGSQVAAAVANDLIDRFRQPFVLGGGREVYVGLSVGISMFPADGDRMEILIQNADAALYSAKEHGRNTFRFYSEALTVAANERLALEADLRRGLALDQFLLHYQPIVRLADGRVEGVEALLRWQSPDRGLVMPSTFIGATEDTGLIVPLGDRVLQWSCRQMKSWLDAGLTLGRVAVNVSPRQLVQHDLEMRVAAILAETGLDAKHLELEITESAIMEQGADAEVRLAALKGLGVCLAIDDFGTGYSSLSHLRRFPIDTFKVDRSFIASVPDDRTQREIVLTIVSLARQLGLHVVAEGAETQRQVDFLREIGCDSAQGFFFSAPVPADRIDEIAGRGP